MAMDSNGPPFLETGGEEPVSVLGDEAECVHDSSSKPPSPRWPAWLDELGSETGYSPSVAGDFPIPDAIVGEGYSCSKEIDRTLQRLEPQPIQQFWEHGFWAEIFASDTAASSSSVSHSMHLFRPVPMFPLAGESEFPTCVEPVEKPQKKLKHASYMDVVASCSVQSWQEQRDSMWETAVRRWHSCILTWKGEDPIVEMVSSKSDFKSQCQIIVDILHNKAPATLLKRCNSISRLVNDLHKHGHDFPCTEEMLYDHMCRQREAGAPHSRLKSLLESVTFVRHVFGVQSMDFCTKSRRCMGVATPKQVEVTKQAPPLLVEHLRMLHTIIETDEDPWNVCFVGMVLFCIYGRARWSDAQHSQFIEWDFDDQGNLCYVQCSTAIHKTCRALNMRHAFLPHSSWSGHLQD